MDTTTIHAAAKEHGRAPGLTEAYLIDIAELGSAVGSGDVELCTDIERDLGIWIDLRTSPNEAQSVRACLWELLAGGALADDNVQGYLDAFALLAVSSAKRSRTPNAS